MKLAANDRLTVRKTPRLKSGFQTSPDLNRCDCGRTGGGDLSAK